MSARARPPWLRPLVIAVLLWVLWLAIALVAGPAAIESAHAGTAPGFVNDLIRGRDSLESAYYLDLWRGLAARVSIALAVLTVVAAIVYRFRSRLKTWLAPVARSISVGPVRPHEVILVAGWIGVVAGLAETVKPAYSFAVRDWPTSDFYMAMFWMTPLANAITLMLVALILVAIALAVLPGRSGLRVIPAIVGTVAVFSFIRRLGGIEPIAAFVLAAGVTTLVLRAATKRPVVAARLLRRSGLAISIALALFAGGLIAGERVKEKRILSSLPVPAGGAMNVLFLILDTVRAADLSLLGYERPTTPNLERLARLGIVFERAWSTAPWTLPSHASMFTGIPAAHLDADYLVPLGDSVPTLAEVLTRAGWASGGFVSNYYYAGKSSGLARGFVHYEGYPSSIPFIAASARLPLRIRRRWMSLRKDERRLVTKTAEDINRAFLDWLPSTDGHPFFAFLNYLDAHDPYSASDPWPERWARPGARYAYGFNERYSESDRQDLRDRYDGSIGYMDEQIGRLMDELETRGQLENTLVIITSDHGEEIGEHDPALVKHGWSLYSQSLHVPLLILLPGRAPAGTRIPQSVSTSNLAATILDIVVPAQRTSLPGSALTRFWNADGGSPKGDAVVSVAKRNPREQPPSTAPIQGGTLESLVLHDLHYIRRADGHEQLFDVVTDPHEMNDLAGDASFAARLEELRHRLSVLGAAPSTR